MSESKGAGDARHIRVPSLLSKPPGSASGTEAQPPIAFTRFDAAGDTPLTKRFTLDPTGKITKISQTQLYRGIAQRQELSRLADLPAFLDSLSSNQCISAGVFDIPQCEIVLDRELTDEMIGKGYRSRAKRFLTSPQHALALFDHDPGEYTPEAQRCATPAALTGMIEQFIPELRGVAYVGAGSSSAGVYNETTGERYPSTGIHLYISTVGIDPAALARIIKVRAWNAGYGYIALSGNGSMLPRCPLDLAVFAPERVVYEALPLLDPGIARDQREWSRREGSALLHIPDPTPDEIAECERRIAAAMRDPELVRKSAELRQSHYEKNVNMLANAAGISVEKARERLPKPPADSGGDVRYLDGDHVVEIKGEFITVDELIARGREFNECSMPDPIEGSAYGTSTAKFYFDERNGGSIHSFAHGQSTTYFLLDFAPCEYTQVVASRPVGPIEQAEPLPDGAFPHMGRYGPRSTILNTRTLIDYYGITVRYDLIARDFVISIPGHSGSTENFNNSALAHITSLANLNGMPTGALPQFIAAIADQNMFNPVADWISSKPWDGVERLPALYATLTTQDDFPVTLKETLIRRWLLSAVAAAFMSGGFSARGVLVLQGRQSLGKTRWIIALVPAGMMREAFLKMDHLLDPNTKDSVLGAIRSWICELGELDASFNRADLGRIKGFITNGLDVIRAPYGRVDIKYQRRTVFAATVNHTEFLIDDTGNTRWWTLPLVAINYDHDIDMQQLWAEVATIYQAGEQWWLSPDEERELELHNQNHRAPSAIRDALLTKLDWDAPTDKWTRRTATGVLELVGYERPSNPQAKECAGILRELAGEPKKSQGAKRWLVPPLREPDFDLFPAVRS